MNPGNSDYQRRVMREELRAQRSSAPPSTLSSKAVAQRTSAPPSTLSSKAMENLASYPKERLDELLQHLTADQFAALEKDLSTDENPDASQLIATLLLRRLVHRVLDKRAGFGDVGAALAQHELQETIDQLIADAAGSKKALWKSLMQHPMTAYVPVQCQHCGHQVPDQTQPGCTDAEVGLSEAEPTPSERPLVRGGWYRGPRGPVVFVLDCPACGKTSRWFRSAATNVTLNQTNWGRLCGDQEDLRTALAAHLQVPLRAAVPLDWDHCWSEFRGDDTESWDIHEGPGDAPAADFARRLDEGIGCWTGVIVISPFAADTCDVSEEYLACKSEGGRADPSLAADMARYVETVRRAREDSTGGATQARSVNGHVVYSRAGFTSADVSVVVQRAVVEHGTNAWWEL